MKKRNLIYGLKDPRNDVFFYIGKTTVGIGRSLQHLTNSHNENVNLLVKEINDLGLSVIVSVIEDMIELNNLNNREKYWINHYFEINEFLLNKVGFMSERDKKIIEINSVEEEVLDNLITGLEDIGKTIKSFRLKRNVTQEELARLCGLYRGTVSLIEKGGTSFNLSNIVCILKILKSYNKPKKSNRRVRYL